MITANASTLFARLIAGAVTLMFFTYAFVNMGMVSGVLPVVGVPLPLVSYGGTALVSLFIGLGHPDERAGAPQARQLVARRPGHPPAGSRAPPAAGRRATPTRESGRR